MTRTSRILLAVSAALLLAIPVLGAVRDEPSPLEFVAVPSGGQPSVDVHVAVVPRRPDRTVGVSALRSQGVPRPNPVVPSPHLVVVPRSEPIGRVGLARGSASWYCGHGSPCTRGYPGGLYAAAGPLLRIGEWRGRYVRVEAGGRVVRVRLIDWCACPNGRVLDLFSDAFRRLAPLSRGVLKVTVSW